MNKYEQYLMDKKSADFDSIREQQLALMASLRALIAQYERDTAMIQAPLPPPTEPWYQRLYSWVRGFA